MYRLGCWVYLIIKFDEIEKKEESKRYIFIKIILFFLFLKF